MKPTTYVPPNFTQRQLDWLEKMFPEITGDASTSHAEFLTHAGKRIVVRAVKDAIQKERPNGVL